MRRTLFAVAVVALVASQGCTEPTSRICGKVTYKGKPLGAATVVFMPPNNQTYPAITNPDGATRGPPACRSN